MDGVEGDSRGKRKCGVTWKRNRRMESTIEKRKEGEVTAKSEDKVGISGVKRTRHGTDGMRKAGGGPKAIRKKKKALRYLNRDGRWREIDI